VVLRSLRSALLSVFVAGCGSSAASVSTETPSNQCLAYDAGYQCVGDPACGAGWVDIHDLQCGNTGALCCAPAGRWGRDASDDVQIFGDAGLDALLSDARPDVVPADGTTDAPSPDSGADATQEAAPPDTGPVDAPADTSPVDAPADTTVHDAGPDTGPDTSVPDAGSDATIDSSPPPSDAGADAD
jgi:hypothetical protein